MKGPCVVLRRLQQRFDVFVSIRVVKARTGGQGVPCAGALSQATTSHMVVRSSKPAHRDFEFALALPRLHATCRDVCNPFAMSKMHKASTRWRRVPR